MEIEAEAANALLNAYCRAASDDEAAHCLNQLFETHLRTWCHEAARRALRNYGLRSGTRGDEESEITAEVMLQLAIRLTAIRREKADSIANLHGYVVSSIYNACFARIRARCPRHAQLQNRIRYLLRHDSHFAEWQNAGNQHLTGLSLWSGRTDALAPILPQRSGGDLREVLRGIFELTGAPIALADLTGAVAETTGVVEDALCPLDTESGHDSLAPSTDRILMEREDLVRLWHEVLQLPPTQRTALLLNLRDGAGQGVIELIPATGTASFEELATALNMTPRALAELWADLPIEDARIATILGISRQKVINLRKSARNRLARRTHGNMEATSTSTRIVRGIRSIIGLGKESK